MMRISPIVLIMGLLLPTRALGDPQTGPLHVPGTNARYFTDDTGNAIYLTGSHTWWNLQDAGIVGEPLSQFVDFPAYLDFLQAHHHNFIRLWTYENYEATDIPTYYRPLPYAQTGPGEALDGSPKFDLTTDHFDPSYFARLRARVRAAGDRGIYVSVMLFQGWSVNSHGSNPWTGHWFHRDNNTSGIDGDPNVTGQGDDTHRLASPVILALQEAYVRHVIDTVGDLDNVLYEISNEDNPSSVEWQNHMIDFIHAYEAGRPAQHPVGMTCNDTEDNSALFASRAEWVSPCARTFDDLSAEYNGPIPVATGRKVVLLDTDHLGYQIFIDNGTFPSDWVWRSFMQGYNPLLMEDLLEAGFEAARRAMGQTRTWSQTINLRDDGPHPELSSTGYALANPGQEYLVYAPDGGRFTVDLSSVSGAIGVQWYNPVSNLVTPGPSVDGGGPVAFNAPFSGNAVLYLLK